MTSWSKIIKFYTLFSSNSLIVLALKFRPLMHLIFINGMKQGSNFILWHMDISCISLICWKNYSIPTEWPWHPCWKSTDHKQGISILFINLSVHPHTNTTLSWYHTDCCFVGGFEISKLESSNFVLCFQEWFG